jgi:hypothetical protein
MTSTKENLGMSSSAIVGIGVIGAELGGLLSGSRFDVQGLYYAVHPEVYGEKWGTQVQITPVMPSLIKKSIV